MQRVAADLHIHSPHSIGVSKNMTVPNLCEGAHQKGISLLGTGDATQPDWLRHLESTLQMNGELLTHDDIAFIPTVEVEDTESIHHVVILPDFESVHHFRNQIKSYSPNLDHEWGGRPRVNLQAESIAGLAREVDGLIGPAHAFTPFRSFLREGKYATPEECYGSESNHVVFLELGLSADSSIADFIPSLRRLTYITCSDAHSPSPDKLGREFTVFDLEAPTFDELRKALERRNGRKPILNVGLHPKLGKYYLSFCSKCRRTLVIREGNSPISFDDLNIYIECRNKEEKSKLLADIHRRRIFCPVDGKPLRLGVRDRAMMLGEVESVSPAYRPRYIHSPPLLEIIQLSLGVKSTKAKAVTSLYKRMTNELGTEIDILTSVAYEKIQDFNARVGQAIEAYRSGTIKYIAGGGGRYGSIIAPWSAG